MTLLPTEQQRIGKGIEDVFSLVEAICVHPECGVQEVEMHHVVRRSHLGGPYDAVEIDGQPMPNVIALCREHHRQITDNEARIYYEERTWWWMEKTYKEKLVPHPMMTSDLARVKAETVLGHPERHGPLYRKGFRPVPSIEEEKICPTCHGKGKLPKKEKKLDAPKRHYKTWSMGIPVDAGENGFEIWKNNLEMCTERVGAILGYSDTVPPYYVLIAVTADWLQHEHETGLE